MRCETSLRNALMRAHDTLANTSRDSTQSISSLTTALESARKSCKSVSRTTAVEGGGDSARDEILLEAEAMLETLLDAHEPPGIVIDAVLTWRGRGHRFRLANWRYGKACAGPHS